MSARSLAVHFPADASTIHRTGTASRLEDMRFATFLLRFTAATLPFIGVAGADHIEPSFRVQTGLLSLKFAEQESSSLAFAGRATDGQPMLGLVRVEQEDLQYREIALPEGAAAIDVGPVSAETGALFVLSAGAVHSLTSFDDDLAKVADATSLFRGRSFAELTSDLDFARDATGDNVAELLVPDFDVLHVVGATASRDIAVPSYRRGYDQTVTYRTPTVAAAPNVAGDTLYTVRGKELLRFDPGSTTARASALGLGLSDELEQETFYNSYEDIDQTDIVLRELERFVDINGDDVPDIVTLETVSEGVFNKTTTYRIHHGRFEDNELSYDGEADTVLSSRGFQLSARVAPLDATRKMLVTASVQVGVRAIIGALFSRAVTMRINVHPSTDDGTIASTPSTNIKARVKFDFGTGQVEFPTIAFGDIDGDGINDLVLKERKRALNWRRGMGDGSFEDRSDDLDVTGPANGANVVLADLTGSGRDELVVLYGRADGDELAGRVAVFGGLAESHSD